MPEPQTFEESVTRFEEFLRQNGYSANLMWVEPGDVVFTGRRTIYVRLPVSAENLKRARERFVSGMREGLGVAFGTICELQNATCCYAWVPKNSVEREQHMMNLGLKLSTKTGASRLRGTAVTSWLRWQGLRLRYQECSGVKELLFG